MATNQDEIDLVELLSKITTSLKRNIWLFLICIVICIAASLSIFYSSPKVYSSRLIVYSDILTQSYSDKLALNIKDLIRDGNFQVLSEKLGVTVDEARKLVNLKIESALDETSQAANEEQKLFLVITVEILDNSVLPKLQAGIIRFVEQNDFVKVRVEQRKRYFSELIQKVSVEIEKLENVKEKIGQGTFQPEGGMVLIDPSEPFLKSVDLFRQRLEYQKELELVNSVQLVEGFVKFNTPIRPRFALTITEGLIAGIILACAIMFLRFISKLPEKTTN